MESQRYINYSKEKHGGEITFIIPSWYEEKVPEYYKLIKNYQKIEEEYMELIEWGCTPQEARDILPNATKTELIMTGFASDWKHLLDLRYFEKTGKVHPDMKLLMEKLKDEAIKYGIWNSMVTD